VVAPRDAFKGLLPIVPTTRREFTPADRVSAFVRVYQQSKTPAPVEVRVGIVDEAGAVLMDRVENIPAESFAGDNSSDVTFELPLSRLRSGSYLLTIETPGRNNTVIRRDVRFEVQ
jgi:hypothetical protein